MAKREEKRGRHKGGLLMDTRKDLEKRSSFEGEAEGMMRGRLRIGGEEWWVIGVYVNGGIGRTLEGLKRWETEKGRY